MATTYSSVLTLLAQFCANTSSITRAQLGAASKSVEKQFYSLPAQSDGTYQAKSFALTTMSRLVSMCLANTQLEAAQIGVELGNAWTELEVAINKVDVSTATTSACTALKAILPFNGSYAPAGA